MSEDLLVDDIDESPEGSQNEAEFEALKQQLIKHCKDSGIEAEVKDYIEGDTYVFVLMPNG